jgi:hypothetical protein
MTDLDQNSSTHSPKKKFSFRFPHLSHSAGHDGSSSNAANGNLSLHLQNANYKEKKNFSEEAKNAPDLQVSFVEKFFNYFSCRTNFTLMWLSEIIIGGKLIIICSSKTLRFSTAIY